MGFLEKQLSEKQQPLYSEQNSWRNEINIYAISAAPAGDGARLSACEISARASKWPRRRRAAGFGDRIMFHFFVRTEQNKTAKDNALYAYDYPLTRDEAVYYYGHPMRQLVHDKNGKLVEVREVPGLLGMPVVKQGGESEMRIVSSLPESIKGLHDLSEQMRAKEGKSGSFTGTVTDKGEISG